MKKITTLLLLFLVVNTIFNINGQEIDKNNLLAKGIYFVNVENKT